MDGGLPQKLKVITVTFGRVTAMARSSGCERLVSPLLFAAAPTDALKLALYPKLKLILC